MEVKYFSTLELTRNGHKKTYSLISIDTSTALCYDLSKQKTVFIKISPSAIRRGMKYNGQRIKNIQDFWNPQVPAACKPQSANANEPQNPNKDHNPVTSTTSPTTSLYGFVREGSICSSGSSASIASLRSIYSDIERRGLNSSEYIKDCVKLECKDIQLSMREKALTEELTAFKLFISEKMAASSKEVHELKLDLKSLMSTTSKEISDLKLELLAHKHQSAGTFDINPAQPLGVSPVAASNAHADEEAVPQKSKNGSIKKSTGEEESPRITKVPGLDLLKLKNGDFTTQGEWFVRRYHRYDIAHVISKFKDFVDLYDLSILLKRYETQSLTNESALSELYRLLRQSNRPVGLIV